MINVAYMTIGNLVNHDSVSKDDIGQNIIYVSYEFHHTVLDSICVVSLYQNYLKSEGT